MKREGSILSGRREAKGFLFWEATHPVPGRPGCVRPGACRRSERREVALPQARARKKSSRLPQRHGLWPVTTTDVLLTAGVMGMSSSALLSLPPRPDKNSGEEGWCLF